MKCKRLIRQILTLLVLSGILSMPGDVIAFQPVKKTKDTKQKPKTSAEAKKRREETQKEIKLTEQQIRENENEVKRNLSELGKLEGSINGTKKKISGLNSKITSLASQIKELESNIDRNETELARLREEYLKAVKKMQISKKNKSDLAFIFSSENFNQGLRRMRYLREFSAWRERQTEEIKGKISVLETEKETLTQAREEQKNALAQQKTAEAKLLAEHNRQETVIAELKKNGAALDSHLKKKQAEANELGNMISQLIASEEQQYREEQRRREEEERKQAEERARQQQLAAEEALKADTGKETEGADMAIASSSKNKKKNTDKKTEQKEGKNDKRARRSKDKKNESGIVAGEKPKEFADARKRIPRSKDASVNEPVNMSGNFADMKGKLPKPTSGSFNVTSRFGRQSLPELPDVVYDNPGVDAESTAGASALAVFKGKVSGVYLLPGYNTVVIVNHGGYYTVYGNIANPAVKVGDTVDAGHGLGTLALNDEDTSHSSIHFEVWKNREKLNPLEWLR